MSVGNFFLVDPDLKLLTWGSSYFSIGKADIAITKSQNVFIKIPSLVDESDRNKFVNNTLNYLIEEGFVNKHKEVDNKIHVWVYN